MAATAIAAMTVAADKARADEYPWCAELTSGTVLTTNCGFVSFEQCRASVSGIGGYCHRNPNYKGTPPQQRARRKRHLN